MTRLKKVLAMHVPSQPIGRGHLICLQDYRVVFVTNSLGIKMIMPRLQRYRKFLSCNRELVENMLMTP